MRALGYLAFGLALLTISALLGFVAFYDEIFGTSELRQESAQVSVEASSTDNGAVTLD